MKHRKSTVRREEERRMQYKEIIIEIDAKYVICPTCNRSKLRYEACPRCGYPDGAWNERHKKNRKSRRIVI